MRCPMDRRILVVISMLLVFFMAGGFPLQAQSRDAMALLEEAAKAMGGMQSLRSLKNQVIASEGKQFDHAVGTRPGGPGLHSSNLRYARTLDLTRPRLRLEWDGRTLFPRQESLQYLEIIDGSVGLLEEHGSKQSRLHTAR